MGNVEVAWEDVFSVIQLVRNHIIVIAVALVCMIAVMVLARKWEKTKKRLIRWQAFICFIVVTALTANIMLSGALYNTLNVILADKGKLLPEDAENSRNTIEDC